MHREMHKSMLNKSTTNRFEVQRNHHHEPPTGSTKSDRIVAWISVGRVRVLDIRCHSNPAYTFPRGEGARKDTGETAPGS